MVERGSYCCVDMSAHACRYRPLPVDVYREASETYPLICTRNDLFDAKLGETLEGLDPVERLLRWVGGVPRAGWLAGGQVIRG